MVSPPLNRFSSDRDWSLRLIQERMKNKARIAGLFYLVTFVAGSLSLMLPGSGLAANLIATFAYVGVTVLFYQIFKPVNASLSLLAALFSLAGIIVGLLTSLKLAAIPINPLGFF